MYKKAVLAAVAIFIAWSAMEYPIHNIILMEDYVATAPLWRPVPEMMFGLMNVVVLAVAALFTLIYTRFIADKHLVTGLAFGLLWGLASGLGMGYGSYAVMPITPTIALVWFLGSVLEGVVAGLIAGLLIKPALAVEPVRVLPAPVFQLQTSSRPRSRRGRGGQGGRSETSGNRAGGTAGGGGGNRSGGAGGNKGGAGGGKPKGDGGGQGGNRPPRRPSPK